MKATRRKSPAERARKAAATKRKAKATPSERDLLLAAIAQHPEDFQLVLGPVHWGPQRTRSGGHLAEIPEPRVRLHDVPGYQREVSIHVTRYIAGRHYWVDIREEGNPIWDAKEQTWAKAWDDRNGDGRSWGEKFNKPESAEDFIQLVLKDHFTGTVYRVTRDYETVTYGREGD